MSKKTPYDNSDEHCEMWFRVKHVSLGIHVADTLDEVKSFAFECFDRLDHNRNGFLSRTELMEAVTDERWGIRERSYICFLLRRLNDIAEAYSEEWHCAQTDGVSRTDIQEYFGHVRTRLGTQQRPVR
ncbi:MAG: hypothetical protein K2X93_04760 [Candidatus Obscuribacterales bacterium]|nr:hypothetical protein [Candidatus Obscuribacterales bacterium]